MQQRHIVRLDRDVSEIGLGCWQLGGDWGDVDDTAAMSVLRAAADSGVTFFDTADVYGDGRSEQFIGRFLKERAGEDLFVATKMGRRVAQERRNYTLDNFRAWNDRSRTQLGVDRLDLVQLHCPPDEVYASDEVFDGLDTLVAEDRIAAYGVSIETVEQGLEAIRRPGVATLQVIYNAFRQKPLEELFPAAAAAGVGVIVRVPLASGMLSGKYTSETQFPADDHRTFNRHGDSFDVGETFAGVPYEVGLAAVEKLRPLVRGGASMAQWALRWILEAEQVSVIIPGARNAEQARANAAAAELPGLTAEDMRTVQAVYDEDIRPHVHARW
ncbi:MAG: aldo/keto reductase [Frankiales bacterium]|nr:aldo/keto reductase [Frankiales bacterium]